jgi:hypothetical protein
MLRNRRISNSWLVKCTNMNIIGIMVSTLIKRWLYCIVCVIFLLRNIFLHQIARIDCRNGSFLSIWRLNIFFFFLLAKFPNANLRNWFVIFLCWSREETPVRTDVINTHRERSSWCSSVVLICERRLEKVEISLFFLRIRVITKLPNSEQSYKGKVKTHNYINRQNQSATGKLWKP